MAIYDDNTQMPWGKHKGKKLIDVPASYLLWLWDQGGMEKNNLSLKMYISENMDVLKKQANENK